MVCFPGYSRRTLAFLGLTFFMQVVVNSTYAIIAPFFPLEAIELGLDTAQVAIVFGSFAVVQLGISPIAGGLCSKFGRRRVLIMGVFIVSGGTFLFGIVPPVCIALETSMMPFFIIARVLQGTGSALTMTCIFAILSDAFPESRGRIIGVAEMMNSLGWTVGPPMGGLLFAIGGFTLPFLICGALPLLTLIGVLSVFPEGGTTPRAAPTPLSTSEAEADQADAEEQERQSAADADGSSEGDEASCHALLKRARRLATPGLFVTAFAATTPGAEHNTTTPCCVEHHLLVAKKRPCLSRLSRQARDQDKEAEPERLIGFSAGTIFALWDIGFTPFVVEEFGFSLETVGLYFAIGPGMYATPVSRLYHVHVTPDVMMMMISPSRHDCGAGTCCSPQQQALSWIRSTRKSTLSVPRRLSLASTLCRSDRTKTGLVSQRSQKRFCSA